MARSAFANDEARTSNATSTPVLSCEGLRKSYGDLVAVNNVSFHISPGETYGLLGPNGAGKTTTIAMVCGLLNRDAGEIMIDGERMTPGSVGLKSRIGYVPQEIAVYPDLSARENLTFFARLYGIPRSEAKSRIGEVLDTVGLADRAGDLVKTYSGGMKRRLNVGLGLIHRPKLLILDEPTVGVDPQSRNSILESVGRLSSEGMAVLYTTHYMEEAERLCDRVGIIDSGELKAEGTQRELVDLVGEHDRIQVTATGDLEAGATAVRRNNSTREASVGDDGITMIVDGARSALPQLITTLAEAGVQVRSIDVTEPDLEAVFLHLTGKALRD
ncbi:MAG: ABC transporter ATP-binding protein [Dehalococcoidia bacterium]